MGLIRYLSILIILGLAVVPAIAEIPEGAIIYKTLNAHTLFKATAELPDNQVYRHHNPTGIATLISSKADGTPGNHYSGHPDITSNGKTTVFHSWADNLLPGLSTGAKSFKKDMDTGEVTVLKDKALSPAISENGKYIAYEYCPNPASLPAVYVLDTDTGSETFVAYTSGGNKKGGWYSPDISIDGINVYFHSTYWDATLKEYRYNINTGKVTEV